MKKIKNLLFLSIAILFLASCSSKSKLAKENSKATQKEYTSSELKIDGLFLDACTQKQLSNLDKAIELFDQVIALDNSYAAAYFEKASILFNRKEVKGAIDLTQKAIDLQPKNTWYRMQMAEIYLIISDYTNAAKVFEDLIVLNPEEKEYYLQLLQIYTQASDENSSKKTLERIEKKWKSDKELTSIKKQYYAIFAEKYMKKRDYVNALKYYQRIEELDPLDPYIHASLANYYLIQGDRTKTFENLEKSIGNKELDYQTKLQVLIAVYGKTVDSNEDDFNNFFTLLKNISKEYPNEKTVWELLATGYSKMENYAKSVESLKTAIELGNLPKSTQPNNYQIYQSLLFAQNQMDATDSLIVDAKKTIELYPEQPVPYLMLGTNQLMKKQYNEALITLEQGVQLVVSDTVLLEEFYTNIAQTHYELKEADKAFLYFDKALELNPDNYIVLNNYAYFLSEENKDLDKAYKMAKKVFEKFPQMPTYVDTYAWVLFIKKDYKEALSVMQNIINQKEKWSPTITEHYEQILKANENQ